MGKNAYEIHLQLDDFGKRKLDYLSEVSGKNKTSVLRYLISECEIHEKPPEELYDLLYDINTLSSDIRTLISRIDNRTATSSHLLYIVDKIDKFYEMISRKYLFGKAQYDAFKKKSACNLQHPDVY